MIDHRRADLRHAAASQLGNAIQHYRTEGIARRDQFGIRNPESPLQRRDADDVHLVASGGEFQLHPRIAPTVGDVALGTIGVQVGPHAHLQVALVFVGVHQLGMRLGRAVEGRLKIAGRVQCSLIG